MLGIVEIGEKGRKKLFATKETGFYALMRPAAFLLLLPLFLSPFFFGSFRSFFRTLIPLFRHPNPCMHEYGSPLPEL